MIKFSIIIPVYQVDKFLRTCLESVVVQTYNNYEVILVDDGSIDNSGKICDEFAEKYDNILVIHKENKGASVARNKGLERATGEYIIFVDSDDIIDSRLLEISAFYIKKYNLQVLAHNYFFYPYDYAKTISIKEKILNCEYDKIFDGYTWMKQNKVIHTNTDMSFLWRFVYQRKLIEELSLVFDKTLVIGEDSIWNIEVFAHTKRMMAIQSRLYGYRINNNDSIMRQKYKPDLEENIEKQYKERMRLTQKYELDKVKSWMYDMAMFYITDIQSMLIGNILNNELMNKKDALKKVFNLTCIRDSYKSLGWKGNYHNKKEFIAFLAMKYRWYWLIYYFYRL